MRANSAVDRHFIGSLCVLDPTSTVVQYARSTSASFSCGAVVVAMDHNGGSVSLSARRCLSIVDGDVTDVVSYLPSLRRQPADPRAQFSNS